MKTTTMLRNYPKSMNLDRALLGAAIERIVECSQVCTACADACLSEDDLSGLRKCVRTDLDCADICDATARVLSRHTGYDANISRSLLRACIAACAACADECELHASVHEHCRVCAEVCRACEAACQELLDAMS